MCSFMRGYLFLASDKGMDILKRNHEVQKGRVPM